MTEREKMEKGLLYDANFDPDILRLREECKDKCFAFNQLKPSDTKGQKKILTKLLGKTAEPFTIIAPFYCDYGCNIEVGKGFFANHNLVILDGAKVAFGENVFIAPNCCFSAAGHPLDIEQRNAGLEFAYPIKVGNNVWIGANVVVLPGVTIGDGTVVGAGSVVNRDLPAGVIAVGNPCKVLRAITEEDKKKYQQQQNAKSLPFPDSLLIRK